MVQPNDPATVLGLIVKNQGCCFSMSNQLNTGLEFSKKSFKILKQKKSLFVFPAISVILILSLFFLILHPLFKIEKIAWETNHITELQWIIFFGLLLGFFFVAHFITLFFNVAVISGITQIVNHGFAKLDVCFKTSCQHFLSLLRWTIILSTIGIVIRFLEDWWDRWPTLKCTNHYLSGLPWLIATFFVVPILITEQCNVITAIKRSALIVKEKWGTSLASRMGIGFIIFVAWVISFIPLIVAIIIGGKTILLIGSVITSVLFLTISILNIATKIVTNTALYLYATQNQHIVKYYDTDMLQKAFYSRMTKRLS